MTEPIEAIAERVDRSMRTSAARGIARRVHEALGNVPAEEAFLDALAAEPTWGRAEGRRFACVFGDRDVRIAIPTPFHPHAMMRLVVRTEINVCLGDCDPILLADLHSLAQRELEQLLSAR